MTPRLLVAAGAVGVLALAGCGGGGGGERLSKDEYQQRGEAIGQRLQDEFSDIETSDAGSLEKVGPLMNRLGEALDALADEFDDLNPPEDIEAAHDQLVSSARATADEARSIADRIGSATLAELSENTEELDISKSESFLEMQKAMNEIQAKGYDFGDGFAG